MKLKYFKSELSKLNIYKHAENFKEYLSAEDQDFIIAKANDLLNNIFTFDKPWDMERCTTPYKLEEIDFESDPNGDEEWCFMLNRMDYLNYLVMAYDLTNNVDYLNKLKSLLMSWIEKHPSIYLQRSTRTLDTAIRLMNIYEALVYLYQEFTDEELEIILDSFNKQFVYLKESFLARYITSNWGSIQTTAICALMPLIDEDYINNDVYKFAHEMLKTQVSVQVYDDGMHWEQSTMYHIEVLNYLMKYVYYANYKDIKVDEEVLNKTKKMVDCIYLQAGPNRCIETFGDTDRSNIEDVLARATIIFKDNKYKNIAFDNLDLESLYHLGTKLAKEYKGIELSDIEELCFDGFDSGMYTVKTSLKDDASFMMFTNGSLGSGHGHCDNLHVSIYHKGKAFMIDTGRYTYREDDPKRCYFKSMKAHNNIIIDGLEYCLPSSSWSNDDFGIVTKNYARHKSNLHYFEGSLLGHSPLSVITRKVMMIADGIYLINDEIKCDGKHSLRASYHLDDSVEIEKRDEYLYSKSHNLKVYASDELKIEDTIVSLRYNELLDSKKIVLEKEFENECNIQLIIVDESIKYQKFDILQDTCNICDKALAEGFEFIDKNTKYSVAIFHHEVYKGKKIFFIDDMPTHAKAIVVKNELGKKELFRMKV